MMKKCFVCVIFGTKKPTKWKVNFSYECHFFRVQYCARNKNIFMKKKNHHNFHLVTFPRANIFITNSLWHRFLYEKNVSQTQAKCWNFYLGNMRGQKELLNSFYFYVELFIRNCWFWKTFQNFQIVKIPCTKF